MGEAKRRGTYAQRKEMAMVNNSKPQQPAETKINMANRKLCECECGSIYFKEVFQIRKLSAIDPQNPIKKDQYPVFARYLCRECGTPFKEE